MISQLVSIKLMWGRDKNVTLVMLLSTEIAGGKLQFVMVFLSTLDVYHCGGRG